MKLDAQDILHKVSILEGELSEYRGLAEDWDKMWRMDAGFAINDAKRSVEEFGREQVILPDPYNATNLAQRLIATKPSIIVPPKTEDDDGFTAAEKTERWLQGLHYTLNRQANANLVAMGTTNTLVRGCNVYEVKWIGDLIPEKWRGHRFPINVRVLDPLNVGVKRGPLYTEYAFHKYEADRIDVKQRYPGLEIWKTEPVNDWRHHNKQKFAVIDFWWTDPKNGDIWNSVCVDSEFAKKPKKMKGYYCIPLIEGYGDAAPFNNPAAQRIGLLHAMNGLWQYKCRLASSAATGSLWATWPYFWVMNEHGQPIEDFVVRPGATDVVPWGTQINVVRPEFNMQTLQAMIDMVDGSIQQATFPRVMYGDAGSVQSGYGINMLTQGAQNRTQSFREYMEMSIQTMHELILSMIEEFADDDGVELYSLDSTGKKAYTETLTGEDIGGYYRNIVSLKPNVPQDDIARETLLIRLTEQKHISSRTLRDNITSITVPPDEENRIWTEQALLTPEMMPRVAVLRLRAYYPDTWKMLVKNTPLEKAAMDMGILPQPQPQPVQGPPGMPPGGDMSPAGGPPMPPPPLTPPGPPGMMPPPEGMPIQPPMELIPPAGGGIPPELQGQMNPEALGLPPGAGALPGMDPLIFAQLMNQPLPPSEELDILAGQGVA